MPVKLDFRASLDRKRIDVEQDWQVLFWATKFNVSGHDVRKAIGTVGCAVEDVKVHLEAAA